MCEVKINDTWKVDNLIKRIKANPVCTKKKGNSNYQSKKIWLFGIHAVREALINTQRKKYELILTPNAFNKIKFSYRKDEISPKIVDPKIFRPPIEPTSVHQGAALKVDPLNWGSVSKICYPNNFSSLVLLLDRVTDPHNVGAIMRSAQVFGTKALIAPKRYSVQETGALAKSASGALERQPYFRVPNLHLTIVALKDMGYYVIGLDADSKSSIDEVLNSINPTPIAIVVGAEGEGLRELTKKSCNELVRINSTTNFASLNVSNAAAVSLFAARGKMNLWPSKD